MRLTISSGPDEQQVARAKALTEDLLEVVRSEHSKVMGQVSQQQMELHQAQIQYAAQSAYYVCMLMFYIPPGLPSTLVLVCNAYTGAY